MLTRADCTTRNRRKAERLQKTYDDLEARIERLAAEEELAVDPARSRRRTRSWRSSGIPPGPLVGEAYRFLLERRIDLGPMSADQATDELLSWWESAVDGSGRD